MLTPRVLAAAIVATGAGAAIFLASGQQPAAPAQPASGPVPVAIPPAVTEAVPTPHPAVPAAERVPPSSMPSTTPAARPAPKRASAPATPTPTPAPKPKRPAAARQAPPVTSQQQPRPADTEPNGTGGWQLPACYDPSCVADPNQGTGTQALNAGPLGQAGIVNTIADLIGRH